MARNYCWTINVVRLKPHPTHVVELGKVGCYPPPKSSTIRAGCARHQPSCLDSSNGLQLPFTLLARRRGDRMKPALAAAVQLNAVSAMSGLLVARDVASITIASGWISPAELAYYRAAYGNLPSEPSRKIR